MHHHVQMEQHSFSIKDVYHKRIGIVQRGNGGLGMDAMLDVVQVIQTVA